MPEPKTKLIDGESFSISQPYVEGHVCNAAEAKTLNQVRSENIGNNLRTLVKEAKEKRDKGDSTDFDKLVETVAAYDAEYTFALGGGGVSRKLDPIEREALGIAKEILKEHLAKTGRTMSKVPDGETKETWAEKVEANLEKLAGREDVLKLAKKRVAEREKLKDGALADLAA